MQRLTLGLLVAFLTIAANVALAQTSSGTAFAVAPELLVTNQHVVAGCSSIEVISADGRRKGSVVAANADIDLAVLRVSGLKGPTARLRNPRVIRLGESVMVFGFPLAGALSSGGNFTSGLVSALRGLRDAAGEIQITAPVQPGNSGGPLLDASGLVIGVVEAKLDALRTARATGDIPQNVNFAISLEVLADFLSQNKVSFRDGAFSAPLDTARVAQLAQSFTHRVECLGRNEQAKVSPSTPPTSAISAQRQLPPCPGYNNTTWTNCVGTLMYGDGSKYVGEWENGRLNGQGTIYRADGSILRSGIWGNGIPVGEPKTDRQAAEKAALRAAIENTQHSPLVGSAMVQTNRAGNIYFANRMYVEAVDKYRIAAEQGYAPAQTNLALMYENGVGITKNYAEAVRWYRKAADQYNPQAEFKLGYMHEMGLGDLPRDLEKAREWYEKASLRGSQDANKGLERLRNK